MGFLRHTQHMGLAALIMGGSIVLSRFMGLLRDKVISWQFGASGEADLYFAAFVVPDFINYLLAGGYVSITLIPLLARRFEEDAEDAWRFFSAVFWWALLVSTLLTALAWWQAPQLSAWVAPGFSPEQLHRLAYFLRIILPAQVFFLAGACFSALLFLRRQFYIPALTPLLYNGMIIAGGLLMPLLGGAQGMEGFCWGVTVGAAVGAFALPWWAAASGGALRIFPVLRHPLMRRFLCIALPLMLGQSVVMLNEQFMRIFGSLVGDGAVSLLSYARRISQVPVGMVGQAAAVASYPFLAALVAQGATARFGQTLSTALNTSLSLCIPLSAWMIAMATPTMCLIFYGGNFGMAETLASAPLLQIMMLAVPLWVVQMLLGRAFYAQGDTLTPALVGTAMTIVSIPAFLLVKTAYGIALITSLGVAAYVGALVVLWLRRQGRGAFVGLQHTLVWSLGCSTLAAVPAAYAAQYSMTLALLPVLAALLALAVGGLLFAAIYVPLIYWRAPTLLEPIIRRFRKK
ncbi:MAG: murein biosynthesis integral membrane protein MurJ [Desulfovibrionaceae bacterium]